MRAERNGSGSGYLGQWFTELIDPQILAGSEWRARTLARLYTWIRPEDELAWVLLSRAYGSFGHSEQQEATLRRGLLRVPESALLRGHLVNRMLTGDRFAEAEEVVRDLKSRSSESPYAWVWAAATAARQNRLAEARQDVDRAVAAIDLDDNAGTAADCSVYLATVMVHRLDARDEALELLQRIFDTGVRDARVGALLGVLKELRGDDDADVVIAKAAGLWRGSRQSFDRFLAGQRRRFSEA